MKRIVSFIVLFLAVSVSILAQQRYTSLYTSQGQIIFLKPHAMAATHGKAKFEYDMTCREKNDTVILNFSVISAVPQKVTGVKIKSQESEIEPVSMKRLYTDVQKRKYTTRMQTSFKYDELKNILTASLPYHFEVTTQDGVLTFEDGKSTWKKERRKLTEVFNLITFGNDNY